MEVTGVVPLASEETLKETNAPGSSLVVTGKSALVTYPVQLKTKMSNNNKRGNKLTVTQDPYATENSKQVAFNPSQKMAKSEKQLRYGLNNKSSRHSQNNSTVAKSGENKIKDRPTQDMDDDSPGDWGRYEDTNTESQNVVNGRYEDYNESRGGRNEKFGSNWEEDYDKNDESNNSLQRFDDPENSDNDEPERADSAERNEYDDDEKPRHNDWRDGRRNGNREMKEAHDLANNLISDEDDNNNEDQDENDDNNSVNNEGSPEVVTYRYNKLFISEGSANTEMGVGSKRDVRKKHSNAEAFLKMAGGDSVPDEFELEKLRAEIQQEKQMKEMLDQSTAELKATVEELEKRFDSIENEGNEWKTRFETQEEMNQQMERQIILLQDKVEEARRNLREANKTPRDSRNFDDLSDANPQMIKALEREKNLHINQLRNFEWRLDQESKAYHKATDERKQYVLEINAAKGTINELKNRQRMMLAVQENNSSPKSHRDPTGNIPNDQRIIDPKKGPIRKTAGVKNLPSLEAV